MRGSASAGRVFKPCGGENLGEGCAFLSQREGRVFLSKIIESLYDGERESARGKALS